MVRGSIDLHLDQVFAWNHGELELSRGDSRNRFGIRIVILGMNGSLFHTVLQNNIFPEKKNKSLP